MNTLTLILVAFVVLAGLRALPRLVTWVRLTGMRLRWPGVSLTGPGAFPRELDPVWVDTSARLHALGFHYHHAQWVEPLAAAEDPRPCMVFREPETGSYASVYPAGTPSAGRAADVTFQTIFDDGHVIATFDDIAHLALAFPPSWDARDHNLDDLEAQWTAHRDAVLARHDHYGAVRLDPDAFVLAEEQALAETVAYLVREGMAAPDTATDRGLRLTTAAAWALAGSMTGGQKRLSAREMGARKDETAAERVRPSKEARVAALVHRFQYSRAAQGRRERSAAVDRTLFLLSAALFSLAVGWLFGWRFVPLLLVVILVHELGHLAGMALFGYQDRRILFIPFVGAAAIGSKENATAFQRMVVLLLGPLPGLVVGLALLFHVGRPAGPLLGGGAGLEGWLFDFGITAVILNYLNLLPVMPLDGGRIVQTLFLGRFPRAQAVFLLGSGLLLAGGGVLATDVVLMALGALTLLAVPWQWRRGTVARLADRRAGRRTTRAEKLRVIFSILDERGGGSQNWGQLAGDVLEHLEAPRARRATAVGGLLLYLAILLAAPVAAAIALVRDPAALLPAGEIGAVTPDSVPAGEP